METPQYSLEEGTSMTLYSELATNPADEHIVAKGGAAFRMRTIEVELALEIAEFYGGAAGRFWLAGAKWRLRGSNATVSDFHLSTAPVAETVSGASRARRKSCTRVHCH